MTGNEVRTRRVRAGLTTKLFGTRLGFSVGAVCNAEGALDGEIQSAAFRLALIEVHDAFAPYDIERDGVRKRKPNSYRIGHKPEEKKEQPELDLGDDFKGVTHAQGERIIEVLEELLSVWGAR
jgi:hypothetical protein